MIEAAITFQTPVCKKKNWLAGFGLHTSLMSGSQGIQTHMLNFSSLFIHMISSITVQTPFYKKVGWFWFGYISKVSLSRYFCLVLYLSSPLHLSERYTSFGPHKLLICNIVNNMWDKVSLDGLSLDVFWSRVDVKDFSIFLYSWIPGPIAVWTCKPLSVPLSVHLQCN